MGINSKLKTDVIYQYNSSVGQNILCDFKSVKQYKLDIFELRNNIISAVRKEGIAHPAYHMIITYYQKPKAREVVIKEHTFIRHRLSEYFNPRYKNQSNKFSLFCFCERHQEVLMSKSIDLVKNTITNIKEYDKINAEIQVGAYHSHLLISEIPDYILYKPKKKLRSLMQVVLGSSEIDENIDFASLQEIKYKLLKAVARESEIVGNGNDAVKVVKADSNYYYDNYYGWEGYIAYCTKKCYNSYMMMDVIDGHNSSLSMFPNRPSFNQAQKKSIYREENE